jgi:hypothetical protein
MKCRQHRFSLAASAGAVLLNFILFSNVQAQSMDLEKYCKSLYGRKSHAVMLFTIDSSDWRCTRGNNFITIKLDDLCHRQYGPTYSPAIGNRSDVKSWSCTQAKVPEVCTQNWDPVCGSDQSGKRVTYSNHCWARAQRATNMVSGECPK